MPRASSGGGGGGATAASRTQPWRRRCCAPAVAVEAAIAAVAAGTGRSFQGAPWLKPDSNGVTLGTFSLGVAAVTTAKCVSQEGLVEESGE